jgi:hypothetical protein
VVVKEEKAPLVTIDGVPAWMGSLPGSQFAPVRPRGSFLDAEANPRVIETRYRSPQLTLWSLGPDEWLLFKRLPDYAARKKRRPSGVTQLPLLSLDTRAQAM